MTYVLCKCVLCGHKQKVGAMPLGEHPMCELCMGPLVPIKAVSK